MARTDINGGYPELAIVELAPRVERFRQNPHSIQAPQPFAPSDLRTKDYGKKLRESN